MRGGGERGGWGIGGWGRGKRRLSSSFLSRKWPEFQWLFSDNWFRVVDLGARRVLWHVIRVSRL